MENRKGRNERRKNAGNKTMERKGRNGRRGRKMARKIENGGK